MSLKKTAGIIIFMIATVILCLYILFMAARFDHPLVTWINSAIEPVLIFLTGVSDAIISLFGG